MACEAPHPSGALDEIAHFARSGQHPSGDDVTDCGAGFVGVSESGEERANALGALDDAKGDLGGNAERAFRANETASQVVARGVKMFTADVDESRGSAGLALAPLTRDSVVLLVLG